MNLLLNRGECQYRVQQSLIELNLFLNKVDTFKNDNQAKIVS